MTPNLEERIHQIIVSANKYAWDHYEIVLDLSENSISKLDSVIQIERLKAKERDSTKFDITKSSRVWGVYLGEIIRKTVGGIWLVEEGDLIFRISEVDIYPIRHVKKILGGQSNLTVYSYYKDFCMKISDGIGFIEGHDTTQTQAIDSIGKLEQTHTPDSPLIEIRETSIYVDSSSSKESDGYAENTRHIHQSATQLHTSQRKSKKRKNFDTILVTTIGVLVIIVGIIGFSSIYKPGGPQKATPLSELPSTWTPASISQIPSMSKSSCMDGDRFQVIINQVRSNVMPGWNVYLAFEHNDMFEDFDKAWYTEQSHGVYALAYTEDYEGCITDMGAYGVVGDLGNDDAAKYLGLVLGALWGAFDETGEGREFIDSSLEKCRGQTLEVSLIDSNENIWLFNCGLDSESAPLVYYIWAMYAMGD